jgi:5-dehydro-2-deoxygluconokinase
VSDDTAAALIRRFYAIGIHPDWWKLEPMTSDLAWEAACAAVRAHDPHCRGVVVLGLDAPEEQLAESFARAARHDIVRGFAVGRTIFAEPARDWLSGRIDDTAAVTAMAGRYARLCALWDRARAERAAAQ